MYNITVTDASKEKIAEMCLENNMVAVRPFVHGGGCSGMAHSMTFADIKETQKYINFKPKTSLHDGISRFVKWFIDYYQYK